MAIEAEVLQDTTTVTAKNALDVHGSDVAVVTSDGVKDVEATSNTYVINSGGMYSGSMSGNIPTWLDQAVTNAIADGTVTLSQALSDLDVYVKNMETGVNQSIASLQTADTTMNTLITTNKSESDTALAAIGQTLTTKITATDATAISQDVLAAEFTNPNSYITNSAWYVNNVKTYADATSANTTSLDAMATVVTDPITGITATANNIKTGYTTIGLNDDGTLSATAGNSELMTAVVGPVEARLTTVEDVSAGYFHEWDGVEAVKIGMIHTTVDGIVYQYYGGSWDEGYQIGWKRLDKAANDAASVVAAKLLTTTNDLQSQIDGAITTWFNDGAPEFLDTDGKYISTNTSADLATNDLVWDVRSGSGQMYKYDGAGATAVDFTAIVFATDANWTAVYKVIPDEAQWYTDDNIDVSSGYVWYDSSNYIQPVLDTTKPVTNLIRANHVGDLYYDKLTGFAYRFSYENLPSDTPDRGVYYSWILITNVNVTKALADAARAQDTADGKRTVFGGTAVPGITFTSGGSTVQVGTGDLWIPEAGVALPYYEGEIYKATVAGSAVTWTIVENYKRTTDAVKGTLSNLQTQTDKKLNTIVSATAPDTTNYTSANDGDYWYDSTNKVINKYTYGATPVWAVTTDISKDVFDFADGKRTIYYLTTPPTASAQIGDMNVNPATKVVTMWDGSAWVDTTNTTTEKLNGWAGGASSLVVDPNSGRVTGYSYADGSFTESTFAITAQNFYVSDGISNLKPFSISGSQIAFNGTVSFSKVDGTPTHSSGTTSPTLGATTAVEGSTYYNTSTKEGFIVSGGSWINNSSVTPQPGVNLISDSAPSLQDPLGRVGWYNTAAAPVYGHNNTSWTCDGNPMPFVTCPGSQVDNKAFDYRISYTKDNNFYPVKAGVTYEFSAYVSSHRCTSFATIAWFDVNHTYISEQRNNSAGVSTAGNTYIEALDRTYIVSTAPSGAVYALIYVRGDTHSSGDDPYIFVVHSYFGVYNGKSLSPYTTNTNASVALTDMSNVTTIDGGKITTGKIQSADGSTYFDLANNQIKMQNTGTGFILDSNAAGTSAAPNISGGYIKGGTIKGSVFIGALSHPSNYLNESAPAPGNGKWNTICNISSTKPAGSQAFTLQIYISFGVSGGNWPDVRLRVAVNGVYYPTVQLKWSVGSVSDATRFYTDTTSRTTSSTITVEALQNSEGYDFIYTASQVSITTVASGV